MGEGRPEPRADLGDLTPYRTSDVSGGRIFLHANENPYPLPDDVMDEIARGVRALELNRYPSGASEVVGLLAEHAGVPGDRIRLGDGSNEVLLHACLAYGGAGRTALLFEPTYRMHHRQARIAGTAVEIAWRSPDDFSIDADEAVRRIEASRPDVVFLCTPNNPTGTLTPREDVLRIAEAAAPALVICDEAYHEFSGVTVADALDEHPNVLVVRTLSKAFRLAGARIGYGIGVPELLEPLSRVAMPYAQSAPTLVAAEVVLRRRAEVLERVAEVTAERDRLAGAMEDIDGVTVFPSAANAVLFRHPEAGRIADGLAERGIVVRNFTTLPGCEDCLRVTAGTPAEGDAFLEALGSLLG